MDEWAVKAKYGKRVIQAWKLRWPEGDFIENVAPLIAHRELLASILSHQGVGYGFTIGIDGVTDYDLVDGMVYIAGPYTVVQVRLLGGDEYVGGVVMRDGWARSFGRFDRVEHIVPIATSVAMYLHAKLAAHKAVNQAS